MPSSSSVVVTAAVPPSQPTEQEAPRTTTSLGTLPSLPSLPPVAAAPEQVVVRVSFAPPDVTHSTGTQASAASPSDHSVPQVVAAVAAAPALASHVISISPSVTECAVQTDPMGATSVPAMHTAPFQGTFQIGNALTRRTDVAVQAATAVDAVFPSSVAPTAVTSATAATGLDALSAPVSDALARGHSAASHVAMSERHVLASSGAPLPGRSDAGAISGPASRPVPSPAIVAKARATFLAPAPELALRHAELARLDRIAKIMQGL